MKIPQESVFPGTTLKSGSKGLFVKFVQEWLTLHGLKVSIDSSFGPLLEVAVRKFQALKGLPQNGMVDSTTWSALWKPLVDVVSMPREVAASRVVAVAQKHLAAHPREVGGQNRGPWVRLYMAGKEGEAWPWCAGFAMYCLMQHHEAIKAPMPLTPSFSTTDLGAQAKKKGRLLSGSSSTTPPLIRPGDLGLIPKSGGGYQHVFIVESVNVKTGKVVTIEGNTNDDGSREGYEVCRRERNIRSCDFISTGPK